MEKVVYSVVNVLMITNTIFVILFLLLCALFVICIIDFIFDIDIKEALKKIFRYKSDNFIKVIVNTINEYDEKVKRRGKEDEDLRAN